MPELKFDLKHNGELSSFCHLNWLLGPKLSITFLKVHFKKFGGLVCGLLFVVFFLVCSFKICKHLKHQFSCNYEHPVKVLLSNKVLERKSAEFNYK